MTRYRSKLEAVVKQRQLREEEIQKEFSDMKNHLQSEGDRLGKLRQEMEETIEKLGEKQAQEMGMNEIDIYYRFMNRQNEKLHDQQKVVQDLTDACELKREELSSAMREKKVVEKIEADRQENFDKELKRKEQHVLDEIAGRPAGEVS